MRERKKSARPTVGAVGQAVESGAVCKAATTSTNNSIISAADSQTFRVADLLSPGAENAISRLDLMALTGLRDRELRRQIEVERRQGVPILSDNINGYWLSDDPAEIKKFSRSMRRRAAEIRLTAMRVEQSVSVEG